MSQFEWTEVLDVGNDFMNDEHKELILKMNRVAQFNQQSLSKKDILFYYDDLVAFTKRHFHDEELFMTEINYPQVEQHRRLHQSLLESLDRYRNEFNASVGGRFPSAVFDLFRTWITTHILVADKQYSAHLKGHDHQEAVTN